MVSLRLALITVDFNVEVDVDLNMIYPKAIYWESGTLCLCNDEVIL